MIPEARANNLTEEPASILGLGLFLLTITLVYGIYSITSCQVGEEVSEAKCLQAGGNPLLCCEAFSNSPYVCKEKLGPK